MAQFRVWPSGGGAAPPEIEISSAEFDALEVVAGVSFDAHQRQALVAACNRFIDQLDLQERATARPGEVREWLKTVADYARKLQGALGDRGTHAKETADFFLRRAMNGRHHVLRIVLGETIEAADRALQESRLFVTDAKNDALGLFANTVAHIVRRAGLKPCTTGADYHHAPEYDLPLVGDSDGCATFVIFFEHLLELLPVASVAKNRNALAKKLQRMLMSRHQDTT